MADDKKDTSNDFATAVLRDFLKGALTTAQIGELRLAIATSVPKYSDFVSLQNQYKEYFCPWDGELHRSVHCDELSKREACPHCGMYTTHEEGCPNKGVSDIG